MYENNYPNDTYHYGTSNTTNGGHQTDAYGGSTYGSGYQNSMNMDDNHYKGSGKGSKKGFGTGKKIAVAICCGVCFGIFAGVGFFAVNTAGSFLTDKVGITTENGGEKVELIEEESDGQDNAGTVSTEQGIAETQVSYTTVTDVTAVVKEVMPSVVSINNKYVERVSFFGQEYSSEARSAGSGFIVGQNDTELLLVSNQHVVDAAEELTVQFVDGTQAQAQLKGVDVDKDLAVIAVRLDDIAADTMSKISIARLGDSDSLTVGEPAIAIGNALGYGQSVTTGVVSALDRAIPTDSQSMDVVSEGDVEINTFIQTDAAINPGNSGGALLNMKGEVIGINSNKIGGSAVEGMGYAIPISDVKPIIEKLMSKQTRLSEEERGYLGITGIDVRADYAELYGLPKGACVSSVVEGAAADQAGIKKGYIITELNGEEIESMSELKEELYYYAAGETVELKVMKMTNEGYEEDILSVTLGKQSSVQ